MSITTLPVRTGLYRHYKGGKYFVQFVAETHDHNGDLDVVYVSLTYGKPYTRPLRKDAREADSWLDLITWPDGQVRTRFVSEYVLTDEERANLESIWHPTQESTP